ncbi:MAG: acetolactate synthase small subunit [Clostridia bacterium]|nr:acetolactate synthase small subunit [Clostridia bacterium]
MEENQSKFVVGVLVENKHGVLMRVTSLFARRGFNIDSLTVGETENHARSRITITSTADDATKTQIIRQLCKLQEVVEIDVMPPESTVIRELMLIKLRATGATRGEILDAVNVFRCKVVDFTPDELCIEMTGQSSKIDAFIEFVAPYGIIEMCRTGVVAVERGSGALIEHGRKEGGQ